MTRPPFALVTFATPICAASHPVTSAALQVCRTPSWRQKDSLTSYCCPQTLSGHSEFGAQVWCDSLGHNILRAIHIGGQGGGLISLLFKSPVTPTFWVQVPSSARFAHQIVYRRVRVIYKQWRYTYSVVTQTVALHKQWRYTNSGATQKWRYTNSGATQTVALHKQWRYTNSGVTQTVALHERWRYTNGGTTQAVALHKQWLFQSSGTI